MALLFAAAAALGAWRWWRVEPSDWFWRLLRAAQVVMVLEAALGGVLLLMGEHSDDLHYVYGLARAGEREAVTEMLASLEDRAEQAKPAEREAWADCTVPAAHGLAAHAKGDHAEAARLLGQAMPHLTPIGGSIAQRALLGAIHLDALLRSGWNDAALKILQADDRERPTVPATKRALADLLRKLGRVEQAMTAEYQAEQLARQYSASKGAAA